MTSAVAESSGRRTSSRRKSAGAFEHVELPPTRSKRARGQAALEEQTAATVAAAQDAATAAMPDAPQLAKRPRGRPRKSAAADAPTTAPEPATATAEANAEPECCEAGANEAPPAKRRRGRSAKTPSKAAAAPGKSTSPGPADGPPHTHEEAAHLSHQLELPTNNERQAKVDPASTSAAGPSPRQLSPGHSPSRKGKPTSPPGTTTAAAAVSTAAGPALGRSPLRAAPPSCKSPTRSAKAQPSPQAASPKADVTAIATAAPIAPTCPTARQSPQRPPLAPVPTAATNSAAAAAAPDIVLSRQASQPGPAPASILDDHSLVEIRRLLLPGASAPAPASTPAARGAAAGGASSVSGAAAAEPAGRSAQFRDLRGMVASCCASGRGGAVYVSGLPGTGKTHTVSRVLASLPSLARELNEGTYCPPSASGTAAPSASPAPTACRGGQGHVPGAPRVSFSFCCTAVNCMSLDEAAAVYCRIQEELLRSVAAEEGKPDPGPGPSTSDSTAAYNSLVDTLQRLARPVVPSAAASVATPASAGRAAAKAGAGSAKKSGAKRGSAAAKGAGEEEGQGAAGPRPLQRVFVVVLDEVDRLLRKRDGEEEMVRLFQLPTTHGLPLVLLSVANSLDLTERMMPLLRARGTSPKHMVFTAYNRLQVRAILEARLSSHPVGRTLFDGAALDMVAKAVSGSSGDLRQALKACRTALDVLADANRAPGAAPKATIGIREMHNALQRLTNGAGAGSAVAAKVRGLPPQQQIALLALATAVGQRAAAAAATECQVQQQAVFTGARPQFVDAVAFREIGNTQRVNGGSANNPGACFDGPPSATPSKAAAGKSAVGASTPTTGRGGGGGVKGVTPPSRTPGSSILAGDAGLALPLADVYGQYSSMCRTLDIPAMSYSSFRTEAVVGLECDGLVRLQEGRTPAAARLKLVVMARDVHQALSDNVMFKRLLGAKAPAGGALQPSAVKV